MKHVLLTGSSRGIGLETATKLLQNHFRVTGTARQSRFPGILSNHASFSGLHVNLEYEEELRNVLKPVFENDCPDILINNAGISVDADFSVADEEWIRIWDRTHRTNLRASALLCKWFVNACLERNTKGIIINVASRAAYRGDTQEYAAYAASKAGMVAVTKSIARDFSRRGIVAYSVAPGFVDTDMAREAVSVYGREYMTQESAFDTITPPGEVANLIAFLAKGDVTQMSGATFHVNGGSYMI